MKRASFLKYLPSTSDLQPTFYFDLGTDTVKALNKEHKFFLSVPNCVIYHTQSGEVLSVGNEAITKQGKLPKNQAFGWPIQRGMIADTAALQHIIEYIFKRFQEKEKTGKVFFPKIVLALPQETSEVERRALQKCWDQIGVAHLEFRSNGLASAAAAGVRQDELQARVIVDIGYSLTQIYVVANSVCIAYRKLETAGQAWTQALIRYLKHEHSVEISHENAESVKQNLGIQPKYTNKVEEEAPSKKGSSSRMPATVVRGRNMRTFFPTTIKVTQADVTTALLPSMSKLLRVIQEIFAELPPAVVADIMKYGIFLVGGSALLPGLKEFLTSAMQIQVWVVDHPESATVKGLELLKKE